MKDRSFSAALASLLSFFFPSVLFPAQASLSDEGRMLAAQADALLNKTQEWDHQSVILCCFVIAVAILGFVIWTLQKVKRPWGKGVASALGLIIVVLTVVNATAFNTDYRMLKRNALQLRAEIMDAKSKLRGFDGADEADKQIYRQEIIDLVKKVESVEEQMLNTQVFIELFSSTYAFSEQPRWISDPPADRFNDYFLGRGEDPSLAVAKELAYSNAVDSAVRRLGSRRAESTPSVDDPLRKHVVRSSVVTQTDYSYDGSRRLYRYHIILKISRTLTRPELIRALAWL